MGSGRRPGGWWLKRSNNPWDDTRAGIHGSSRGCGKLFGRHGDGHLGRSSVGTKRGAVGPGSRLPICRNRPVDKRFHAPGRVGGRSYVGVMEGTSLGEDRGGADGVRAGGAAALVKVAGGGRPAPQRAAGRGGPGRAGPGAQRGGRADRDGQAAAAVDPGVRGDGAGRVRHLGRGPRPGSDPGAAPPAHRQVRAPVSSSGGRTSSSTAGRSSQPYADDGMAEYRLRLDPEGQALKPSWAGGRAPTLHRHGSDPRTSDQRRADALVEVCRRAAAAGGSAPTTPKAAVVATTTTRTSRAGPGPGRR